MKRILFIVVAEMEFTMTALSKDGDVFQEGGIY